MNTIKETLIEKRNAIEATLSQLYNEQSELVVAKAKQLLEIPEHVEVRNGYDSIFIFLDGKEILSINNRTYGNPYLNTYSTMMDDKFEFERLVINGKIAEKFLYDNGMFDKLFASVSESLIANVKQCEAQIYDLDKEINRLEKEEKEAAKKAALDSFFSGNEVKFEGPITRLFYGRGKFDYINRVTAIKCLAASKSKTKVNVEITSKPWDETQNDTVYSRENIKVDYLLHYMLENSAK